MSARSVVVRPLVLSVEELVELEDRFWEKVSVHPLGCQLWTGGLKDGYGRVCRSRRWWRKTGGMLILRAPRVAWLLAHGPIPAGRLVLHHCDVRACVNAAHLYLGDYVDNHRDMRRRGRARGGQLGRPEALRALRVEGATHG